MSPLALQELTEDSPMSSLSTLDAMEPSLGVTSAGRTPVAAGPRVPMGSGELCLLAKKLPTTTCPHCARREGEVPASVRAGGRLRRPGRLVAMTLLSSVFLISIIPCFPLLLLWAWHDESSVGLEVHLCRRCAGRLQWGDRLTRYAYYAVGLLPVVGFMGGAVYASASDRFFSLVEFLALELTLFAISLVGVAVLRRERRRRLPWVLDFDGHVWRTKLPAAWHTVLVDEAAKLVKDAGPRR